MPTSKQVRYHYGRIFKLQQKLARALSEARNAEVIFYKDYQSESPCNTNDFTLDRIRSTCNDQLAKATHKEIVFGKKCRF